MWVSVAALKRRRCNAPPALLKWPWVSCGSTDTEGGAELLSVLRSHAQLKDGDHTAATIMCWNVLKAHTWRKRIQSLIQRTAVILNRHRKCLSCSQQVKRRQIISREAEGVRCAWRVYTETNVIRSARHIRNCSEDSDNVSLRKLKRVAVVYINLSRQNKINTNRAGKDNPAFRHLRISFIW